MTITMTAEDGMVVCWKLLIAATDVAPIPRWRRRRREQQGRLLCEASRLFGRLLDAPADAEITIPASSNSPLTTTYRDVAARRAEKGGE